MTANELALIAINTQAPDACCCCDLTCGVCGRQPQSRTGRSYVCVKEEKETKKKSRNERLFVASAGFPRWLLSSWTESACARLSVCVKVGVSCRASWSPCALRVATTPLCSTHPCWIKKPFLDSYTQLFGTRSFSQLLQ